VKSDIKEQGSNFDHNYWFLLAPKSASLQQIITTVDEVHPPIKRYLKAAATQGNTPSLREREEQKADERKRQMQELQGMKKAG